MLVFLFVLLVFYVQATDYNPSYPRIASFQWGGATPELYARYDLVDISFDNAASSLPQEIKAINPNTIILGTKEWRIYDFYGGCPEEWRLRTSNEDHIKLYDPDGYYADPTDYCRPSPAHGNMKFNEWLAQSYIDSFDFNYVDGVATDGIHRYAGDLIALSGNQFGSQDVDLDRDGQNDLDQHGGDWIEQTFVAGCDKLLSNMRQALENNNLGNRPILINTGTLEDWGAGIANGFIDEYASVPRYWGQGFIQKYNSVVNSRKEPSMVLINGLITDKHDFKDMRYLLTMTLMGDGYFDCEEVGYSLTDQKDIRDHYYNEWYDEFEIDLGYPTGVYQRLSNGVFVRFFNNGVAITNPQGEARTISISMLQGLQGYDGPYYHFEGGQDYSVNNGQEFSSFDLHGRKEQDEGTSSRHFGDGLILLKQPLKIVTDIIIDHTRAFTSAGSQMAELKGDWHMQCCQDYNECSDPWTWGCRYSYVGENIWDQVCEINNPKTEGCDNPGLIQYKRVGNTHDIAFTSYTGASAIYRPSIGLAGEYEVFEWHPQKTGATTIGYEIHHSSGAATGTIDQRDNTGQWNSLGKYNFDKGTSGFVELSNTNGFIVADAIKFVNTGSVSDTPPPQSLLGDLNRDGVVDIMDLVLLVRAFGTSQYDLTEDGAVDVQDILVIIKKL